MAGHLMCRQDDYPPYPDELVPDKTPDAIRARHVPKVQMYGMQVVTGGADDPASAQAVPGRPSAVRAALEGLRAEVDGIGPYAQEDRTWVPRARVLAAIDARLAALDA